MILKNNKEKKESIIKYLVIIVISFCILFFIDAFIMVFTGRWFRIPKAVILLYPVGPVGLFILVGGCILAGFISKFDEIRAILHKIFPAGISSNKIYIIGLILATAGNLWMIIISQYIIELDFLIKISSLAPVASIIFLFFGEMQAKIKNTNVPTRGFTVLLNFLNLFLFFQISKGMNIHFNYCPIVFKNIHFLGVLITIILALGYLSIWLTNRIDKIIGEGLNKLTKIGIVLLILAWLSFLFINFAKLLSDYGITMFFWSQRVVRGCFLTAILFLITGEIRAKLKKEKKIRIWRIITICVISFYILFR